MKWNYVLPNFYFCSKVIIITDDESLVKLSYEIILNYRAQKFRNHGHFRFYGMYYEMLIKR